MLPKCQNKMKLHRGHQLLFLTEMLILICEHMRNGDVFSPLFDIYCNPLNLNRIYIFFKFYCQINTPIKDKHIPGIFIYWIINYHLDIILNVRLFFLKIFKSWFKCMILIVIDSHWINICIIWTQMQIIMDCTKLDVDSIWAQKKNRTLSIENKIEIISKMLFFALPWLSEIPHIKHS